MKPVPAPTARRGPLRYPMAWLLTTLLVLMAASPWVDHVQHGHLVESTALTLVLLAAVLAVRATRRMLLLAVLLVMPALVGRWLSQAPTGLALHEASLAAGIVFTAFVAAHLLRFVLRAAEVDSEVLCAAIATYFLLALAWAFAYQIGARLDPDAFAYTVGPARQTLSSFKAMYFSLGTLTSVAYGDILPFSNAMRTVAMAEVATGMFYMAILISRLVSLYTVRRT